MLWRNVSYLIRLTRQGFDNPRYVLRITAIALTTTLLFGLLFYFAVPDHRLFPTNVETGSWLRATIAVLTHPIVFFLVGMLGAWWVAYGLMVQLVSGLYDIPAQEAEGFVTRLLYGLPENPPKGPTLVVREAQILPSTPDVLLKVGGPAFISVGHDSAVVLSRKGHIERVLGPGFHTLESFETVWDIVDLRPQRREIKVETYTRDGIPITCEAEMLFNLDNGKEPRHQALPFEEECEKAVLELTTDKVVLESEKGDKFTPWTGRMYKAILDGRIREWIEQYRLDDLISPTSAGEPMVARLQKEVEAQIKQEAESLGVWVERVEIKSLRPDEDLISEHWLELWRSEWDYEENRRKAAAQAQGSREIQVARLKARANLLTEMLPRVEDWDFEEMDLLRTLKMNKFMEAIQAMSDVTDPIVRANVFHQAKELHALVHDLEEEIEEIDNPPDDALEDGG